MVYDYSIECVISLRDKLLKLRQEIENDIDMTLEDLCFLNLQYLNHPIPKPYVSYEEMQRQKDIIFCKCGKEFNINNIKKHLSHPAGEHSQTMWARFWEF